MPKPWAKVEVGYMRHPKFLALNGNAISLWHEGKDFCDAHHTDGMIPKEAVKTFRFAGKKTLAMLLASCGQKPDGTPYAALWEVHAVGYRMHDYLDHNDCREAVLARLEDAEDAAEIRRLANRDRQTKFRADRKARLEALRVTPGERDSNGDITRTRTTPTETVTTTETERTRASDAPARPLAAKRKLYAAFEGPRVYVPMDTHRRFLALRNHPDAEKELQDWYLQVSDEWYDGAKQRLEPGANMLAFWDARYNERWPPAASMRAVARQRPVWK